MIGDLPETLPADARQHDFTGDLVRYRCPVGHPFIADNMVTLQAGGEV